MKSIPVALQNHYDAGTTTLANCWKATRTDNTVFGFTDCDIDLEIDGIMYLASTGFTPASIQNQTKLAADNFEITSLFESDVITADDLSSGLWNYAQIEMFVVNFRNVAAGKDVLGVFRLGEVSVNGNSFKAEIRGLANHYAQSVGSIYQPTCRARFCDAKCGLNVASFTYTGSLTGVSNDQITLYDTGRTETAGTFNYGLITMTSGASVGTSMEIKTHITGQLTLQLEFPLGVAVGDTYEVIVGCAKRFNEDCVTRFSNGINFRGEPHLPGNDKIWTYGSR